MNKKSEVLQDIGYLTKLFNQLLKRANKKDFAIVIFTDFADGTFTIFASVSFIYLFIYLAIFATQQKAFAIVTTTLLN